MKNREIIRFLIEQGADVNAKDNEGKTHLHIAADSNYKIVVKHLCKQGAEKI